MKARVESRIGDAAKGITVSTYHSFCARLLRKYAELLGWTRDFSIFDTDDTKSTIEDILKKLPDDGSKLRKDFKAIQAVGPISRYKEQMMSPAEAKASAETAYERLIAEIYEEYAKKLKEENAFDFDDLIYMMIRIFERYPEVQQEVNKKYIYITARFRWPLFR